MSEADEFKEIIDEFLVESHENLDRLDTELVSLEQDADPDTLASIFRTIHTIKGTSGFLGFSVLERLTHVGEFLLSKLRDGELEVTEANTSALLRMVDVVRDLLSIVQESGSDAGGPPIDDLVAELERLQQPDAERPAPAADPVPVVVEATAPADQEVAVTDPDPAAASEPATEPDGAPPLASPSGAGPAADPPEAEAEADRDAVRVPTFGDLVVAQGLVDQEAVDEAARRQAEGDPRHIGELLVESGALAPEAVAETLIEQREVRDAKSQGSPTDSVIRVDVGLLDNLMNLVGELVLARNQILQFTQASGDAVLTGTSQRLNLITTELQEGVMKTRMQPIDNVWSRFPRVVRDLALACEKRVRIEMIGRETELDRTILEAIKDPLTHLIRNSIDHGIETPAERESRSKNPEGTVLLRAFHEGGQVNIEISDDGRGLAQDKIRAKALERSLITPAQADSMSAREITNLIFEPGFSTADKVTNVSGRGVGMDVVKTNIEAIGGTIDVQTDAGRGTTFRIKIPLTLAIIPALVIGSGDERYAIPQVSLLELLRIDVRETPIEVVAGTPVFRLRGDLLPIVHLDDIFGSAGTCSRPVVDEVAALEAGSDPAEADSDQADITNIVVVQSDGRPFGLVVDAIMDTAEIVVKPLGAMLKPIQVFAGATIMGDGRVALILDVPGIAGMSGVFTGGSDPRGSQSEAVVEDEFRRTLLLANIGDREVALMLDLVARLEEFPVDRIERAGNRPVVQYRGDIMPLVFVDEALGAPVRRDDSETITVIVHTVDGVSVGLVVDGIHDIVSQSLEMERISSTPGLLGSAVVQGKVVDIVDGQALVAQARPARVKEHA